MKGVRKICGLALVGVLGTCACTSKATSTDGATSWLRECNTNADCGDELACECGICTNSCQSSSDCGGLKEAVCLPQETTDLSCAEGGARLCIAVCSDSSDCAELGRDARCEGGFCSRTPMPAATASNAQSPSIASDASAPADSQNSPLMISDASPPSDPAPNTPELPDAGPSSTPTRNAAPDAAQSAIRAKDAGSGIVRDAEAISLQGADAEVREPIESTPAPWQQALDTCGSPRQTVYLADSGEQLQSLMLGDWVACTAGAFLGEDEVGLRFNDDTTFDLLYLNGDQLVIGEDAAQRGTWMAGDNGTGGGGDPAISFQPASEPGGGYWIYVPRFSDDPLRWRTVTGYSDGNEVEFVSIPSSE